MSRENVGIVRQQMFVRANARRHLVEERLLRFPRLLAFLARQALRLPLRSRLRTTVIRRAIEAGVAVLNRGEPEIAFGIYHLDCEFVVDHPFPGLPPGTRGRDARIRFQQQWNVEWGAFWFEPEELISFGDNRSLLILGRVKGTGRSSGAGFDSEWAALFTLKGGWIIKERAFFDQRQALNAAGLSKERLLASGQPPRGGVLRSGRR
jgi:ketosteroid isomerase-like protein